MCPVFVNNKKRLYYANHSKQNSNTINSHQLRRLRKWPTDCPYPWLATESQSMGETNRRIGGWRVPSNRLRQAGVRPIRCALERIRLRCDGGRPPRDRKKNV